jgi:mRNA interferase MazF
MQSMAKTLTADDILPLVASLTPRERVRLLRLIALPQGADAVVYRSVPPSNDEFSADEEPLAWDAEGLGGCGVKRGEIRWYTFRLPDKRRPVLILTRNDVIDRLNEIVVGPATRTIRGLTPEVVLTVDDGMPAACALNFDHVSLAQRSRIGPVLSDLLETRWAEVREALLIACGFGKSSD